MANGRNGGKARHDSGRVAGGFVALPWDVLDSPAYAALGYPARALLLEIARQYVRDNNGRLLASSAYLSKRGWNSADVLTRAKRELLAAGFIHETVMGHRPNKASWYAVTWQSLDKLQGFDAGAAATFEKGAYRLRGRPQIAGLRPEAGVARPAIAPPSGVGDCSTAPPPGAIQSRNGRPSTPSLGNHLEMPSEGVSMVATEVLTMEVGN